MKVLEIIAKFLNKTSSLGFLSKLIGNYPRIRNPIYLKYYISRLKRIQNNGSLGDLVNFVLIGNNILDLIFLGRGSIYTRQIKSEILRFLVVLEREKPKNILEIGTAGGGSLFLISQVASNGAKIISIDLPGGIHGGGYPTWKGSLYKQSILPTQKLILLRENSHHNSTHSKVVKILGEEKLDLLLIDGDHTYSGVKRDFELYSPLIKNNGIIALHDIVKHPPELNCGVDRFWKEIRNNFNFSEIVDDWNQGWAGFGILTKKYNPS